MMPSSAPMSIVRVGTPESRSRRPGSTYLTTLPTTMIAAAMPSTHQPSASLRGTAHTAMPASTSSRPGSTGSRTPTMPTTISNPAITVSVTRGCSHARTSAGLTTP
jgi:hypothetical protein